MSFLNSCCIHVELNSKCQREISFSRGHWKLTIFIFIYCLSFLPVVLFCYKCHFNYLKGDLNNVVRYAENCLRGW